MSVQEHNTKPLLKWAGGKRWLVPYLLPICKPLGDYKIVEPFCGGLAVELTHSKLLSYFII